MRIHYTKRMLIDTVSVGTASVLTGTPFMIVLVHVNFVQWYSWAAAVYLNCALLGWLISMIVDKFRKVFHVD